MPRKKKNDTDTPSLSTTGTKLPKKQIPIDDVTGEENLQLKEMIKNQLADYVRKGKIKEQVVGELTNIIQEYLSCCMLLGYDFQGQPVTIVSVNNQQEADALGTMVNRFITSQRYGSPPDAMPPGGEPGL